MLEVKEEFRQRLEKALADAGMRPSELAERTGISQSTISQYRSGYSKPKSDRLQKIAGVLGVDPAWLMGLDVQKTLYEDSGRLAELMKRYAAADDLTKAMIDKLLKDVKIDG